MSQHESNTSFPEKSQTNSPESESLPSSPNDNQKVYSFTFFLSILILKKKLFFFRYLAYRSKNCSYFIKELAT